MSTMKLWKMFKKKYPGCVLIFRVGDDYEAYYRDAEIYSKILGMPLAIRHRLNNFIPFISILHCAIERCIGKMIAANYKVAIFEQRETDNCMRNVVRIVTPSSLI